MLIAIQMNIAAQVTKITNNFVFQNNLYDPFGILRVFFTMVLTNIRQYTRQQISNVIIYLMITFAVLESIFNSIPLFGILFSNNPWLSFCIYSVGMFGFLLPSKNTKCIVLTITLILNLTYENYFMAFINVMNLLLIFSWEFISAIFIHEFVSFATTTVIDEIVDNRQQILFIMEDINYQNISNQINTICQTAKNTQISNVLQSCKQVSNSILSQLCSLYFAIDMEKYRKLTYGIFFSFLMTFIFVYFSSFSWTILLLCISMCTMHVYKNIYYIRENAYEKELLRHIMIPYNFIEKINRTIYDAMNFITFSTVTRDGIQERDSISTIIGATGMFLSGSSIVNRYN